jgi:signal transduction histidine kinase
VSRVSIRVRLAAATTLAMLVMLVAAAGVVYFRLSSDLGDRVDDDLRAQADALVRRPLVLAGLVPAPGDPEEGLTQVLTEDGRLVSSVGGRRGATAVPALTPSQAASAAGRPAILERRLAAWDGTMRLYARPVDPTDGRRRVLVVGRSLNDRNDALASVLGSFAVGGFLALLLTPACGYALARAGLAPVEAMRRRAGEISLAGADQGLPLPAAHDELRRLGQTLNQMLDRLRESYARQTRFVADASHELRTPLAVLETELEGALLAGDHGPATRESLVAAVEECDRLGHLAADLLVLARADDGGLPVHPVPTPARYLLDGVAARFSTRVTQQGRTIRVDYPASSPNVLADPDNPEDPDNRGPTAHWLDVDPERLRQALSNLVDNAIRHGAGEIVLRLRRHTDGVTLEVQDSGGGIPAEFAPDAFERFARADPARTGDGAGLGLSIVAAIAQAHGGHATILPGPGATVRITLPTPASS